MKTSIFVATLIAAASASRASLRQEEVEFANFTAKFGKSYKDTAEWEQRKGNFKKAKAFVDNFKSDTMTVELNKFADWSDAEYNKLLGVGAVDKKNAPKVGAPPEGKGKNKDSDGGDGGDGSSGDPTPVVTEPYRMAPAFPSDATEVNWVTAGQVSPVKDQGSCGSCWTFAAAAALEANYHIKYGGEFFDLSEQQDVECVRNSDCGGGHTYKALEYHVGNGYRTEADYPYEARNGRCSERGLPEAVRTFNSGYKMIAYERPDLLKEALRYETVAVYIYASDDAWRYGNTGIISSNECSTNMTINHAVVAVGFGVMDGQEYFLIKNSWGSGWGENGYRKIAIEQGNGACGITYYYPQIPDINLPMAGA